MRLYRDIPIRNKLEWIVVGACAVALLLASAAFTIYDRATFRAAKIQDVTTLADVIGLNSIGALTFQDISSATDVLSGLKSKHQISEACIYDARQSFAKYARDYSPGDLAAFSPPAAEQNTTRFEHGYMLLFRNITLRGETIGSVYIRYDLSEMHDRLIRYVIMVAFVAVGCMLISFALASWLQQSISEPLTKLAATTRMVSLDKNYSVR
ncbi:MAG: hypothetical protein M3P45_02250, partial [Acidobacteriota bacterium]|nr:hypothetical protein [Acidobacteriota bacterium]